mmetsp:Transcript_22118/g.28642  ORF Transcript_22118/g.28642 Transcript_22118/m.28642 type:complete len:272 (+) Transcript_22118:64-879(+)|eukprot:CAMPEP_0197295860 /NCGR_PEP_ID=MMETSP0890-20130614/36719_1 /TAXON_ID=44058 ORGANISM="Aureoumbra lagunensis, Strain CCMP1510" /NCGR_SAMPLE_ID=MMETSP0890 /ASSEMBLY_ACC=CAM_ASM_000533 /LENGTH=271 /DNA_ID=CAMNT_0042772081 /DNA_START=26 /DNA_END=841 /DNA_ORIENTATION=-
MPIDYSKFDKIDISDEEDDTKTSVTKKSSTKSVSKKATSSSTGKSKPKRPTPKENEQQDDESDDDVPLNWYRHRETKLPPSSTGPVKLDKPVTEEALNVGERSPSQASVWNKAGTWEERSVMPFVKERVEKVCKSTKHEFIKGAVHVEEVSVSGDASVGIIRGKPRRILDINIQVELQILLGDSKYKATIHINEFTHDALSESIECILALKDDASIPTDRAAMLRLELIGTPTLTQCSVPPKERSSGSANYLANSIVSALRSQFLTDFLQL